MWESLSADRRLRLYWWYCELESDSLEPNPEEVQAVGWFTPEEALALPGLLDGNREFLSRFRSRLEQGDDPPAEPGPR